MLTLERLDSISALSQIKSEWDALLSECPHRTPFLTYDWILNWLKYFGRGKQPCVVVVRDSGRPVMIAPLMKYRGWLNRRYAPIPTVVLETIGPPNSFRSDFIYKELQESHLTALWQYLVEAESWHVLRCNQLLEESPTVAGLTELIRRLDIRAVLISSQRSPYISIPGSWTALERTLSGNFRKQLRAYAKRAAFSFDCVNSSEALSGALGEVFEIARRGWAAGRGTAITSTDASRCFFTDIAHTWAQRRRLLLGVLRIEGKPIAYDYSIRNDGKIYSLKAAFDPEYSRFAPGHLLTRFALEKFCEESTGIHEYDMLGEDEPYKLRWTKDLRLHLKMHLYHPDAWYSRGLHYVHTALSRHPAMRTRSEILRPAA